MTPPRTVFISTSKEIATIPLMQSIHYTCNNNRNEFFWCLFHNNNLKKGKLTEIADINNFQFMTTSMSNFFQYPVYVPLFTNTDQHYSVRCLVEHNHACVHYELMELHIKYCAWAVVQVCHFFRFSNLIYLFIYV